MTTPKHVLVCGAGSVGRRHIANLLDLGVSLSVWRERTALLPEIARDFPVRTCDDLSSAVRSADAVVVATATDKHVSVAQEVLQAGRALFLEKPVSHNWHGIAQLCDLAAGRVVEVGCQFRAHPNLVALARTLHAEDDGRPLTYRLAMGHRLDAWRATQDYREGYSADAARGGGALLDLIHMIDLALWNFGPVATVSATLSNVGNLEIRGDDVANLLLTHDSGITGQVQLDMTSPVYRCDIEVMTTSALFRWASADGVLRRLTRGGENIADRLPVEFQRNDLFVSHMKHFLERLDDPALPPLCSFEAGAAALEVALGAREADRCGHRVPVGLAP